MDIDVMKMKQSTGGLPQTDNFAVLLVQGLESSDPEILNVSVNSVVVREDSLLYQIAIFSILFIRFYVLLMCKSPWKLY